MNKVKNYWTRLPRQWRNSKHTPTLIIQHSGWLGSFFMIVFTSFVDASDKHFSQTFLEWIRVGRQHSFLQSNDLNLETRKRHEQRLESVLLPSLWLYLRFLSSSLSQVRFLRKTYGSKLNVFAPINDLSSLSKSNFETRSFVAGKQNDLAIAGGQVLGDEYTDHVIKVSSPCSLPVSPLYLRWIEFGGR